MYKSHDNVPTLNLVYMFPYSNQVLEFEGKNPTPEEIKSQCRKLSKRWHPDQFKTETEKAAAQEKFIEIQKACEALNQLKKRRSQKNMKSDTSSDSGKQKKQRDRTEFQSRCIYMNKGYVIIEMQQIPCSTKLLHILISSFDIEEIITFLSANSGFIIMAYTR